MEGVGGRPVGPGQDGGGAQRLERGGERVDVIGARRPTRGARAAPGARRPRRRPPRSPRAPRGRGRPRPDSRVGSRSTSPGARCARARAATARSSGITCIFWPKPPPVSGTITRTRASGRPKARATPVAEDVRHLAAGPERERVALPARDHAAASSGEAEQRAWVNVSRITHGGAREGTVHVALAAATLEEHVGAVLGVEPRRVGDRARRPRRAPRAADRTRPGRAPQPSTAA